MCKNSIAINYQLLTINYKSFLNLCNPTISESLVASQVL